MMLTRAVNRKLHRKLHQSLKCVEILKFNKNALPTVQPDQFSNTKNTHSEE